MQIKIFSYLSLHLFKKTEEGSECQAYTTETKK